MPLNILVNAPPPYDPLRDPIWQFVGVTVAILFGIIAVAGLVFGIISYSKQQRRKEITYQIISDAPIASINKAVENRVELRLDGNPVKDTRLLVLKVWNSGNLSIKEEDYFEPIRFEFQGGTVIGSEVLETEPKDLINPKDIKTFLKQESSFIELPKFPLNPSDVITLAVLLTSKSRVSKRGRISEGKIVVFNIEKSKSIKPISLLSMRSLIIFLILTALISYFTGLIFFSILSILLAITFTILSSL